jgi:tripartite-type tricarboxylate transporter receptor subunit TctC
MRCKKARVRQSGRNANTQADIVAKFNHSQPSFMGGTAKTAQAGALLSAMHPVNSRNIMKKPLATVLLGFSASTLADWPSKPVAMLVPRQAGDSTDLIARTLAPKLQEKLGGPTDAIFMNIRSGLANIRSGKVRALAIASDSRSPLPDVPTLKECGAKSVPVHSWQAFARRKQVIGEGGIKAD